MHEQSETRPMPFGGAYNISGLTGEWLRPRFGFERMEYSSIPTAVAAAEARSNLFGMLVDSIMTQPLQHRRLGFQPTFLPRMSLETLIDAYAEADKHKGFNR